MTISTEPAPLSYSGDGATTTFSITWKYLAKSHVVVTLRDASAVETTWTLGSEYTLTDAGIDAGGTLTVDTAPVDYTPATGETLVIELEPPNTQDSSLPLGGPFPSTTVEDELDEAAQRDAKIETLFDRSISVPKTDTQVGANLILPIDSARASKAFQFDANGKPLMVVPTDASGTNVTATSGSTSRALADWVENSEFRFGHTNPANVLVWNAAKAKWGLEFDVDRATPVFYFDGRVNDAALAGDVENDIVRVQFKSYATDASNVAEVVGLAVFGKQSGGTNGQLKGLISSIAVEATFDAKAVACELIIDNKGTDTGSDNFGDAVRKNGLSLNADGTAASFAAAIVGGSMTDGWHNGFVCVQDKVAKRAFWAQNTFVVMSKDGKTAIGSDTDPTFFLSINGTAATADMEMRSTNTLGASIVMNHVGTGVTGEVIGQIKAVGWDDAGNTGQDYCRLNMISSNAADASEEGEYSFKTAVSGTLTTILQLKGNKIGFFNKTAVGKPTVSGSRAGNAALADLLTELASLGLITDSSTA